MVQLKKKGDEKMNQEVYPLVVPRLSFNGQCTQALELYKEAFSATVKEKIHFSEADPRDFQYKNEDEKNFVYYAELMIGKHMVMMHDDSNSLLDKEANEKISSTALCISFESEEKARAAYQILSDGGKILTPIHSTSFCSFYVSLVDKFGVSWDLYFGDA